MGRCRAQSADANSPPAAIAVCAEITQHKSSPQLAAAPTKQRVIFDENGPVSRRVSRGLFEGDRLSRLSPSPTKSRPTATPATTCSKTPKFQGNFFPISLRPSNRPGQKKSLNPHLARLQPKAYQNGRRTGPLEQSRWELPMSSKNATFKIESVRKDGRFVPSDLRGLKGGMCDD